MRRFSSVALAALACLVGIVDSASAQSRQATIAIPAGVSFNVVDPAVSTTGNPAPFRVTITNGSVGGGQRIYVSVKADTTNFSGPGTTRIPASNVSWTATAVDGGTASAGTLSSTAYLQVYRTRTNPGSGAVDMTWRLAAPAAAGLRAGTHSLTVRWRIEAF